MLKKTLKWLGYSLLGLAVLLAGALVVLHTPDIPVATLRARYGSPASQYLPLSPGGTIHLRDEGPRGGFPIVLLHGSNASLHTWEPWRAALVAKGYRVISFDFPGHGLSSPVPSRDYSAQSYADVTENVVKHFGLTRFVIGGNSMGGGVAWLYAHRHPDQVAGLVLVDAAGQPVRGKAAELPLGFRIARMPLVRNIGEIVTPRSMIEKSLRQTVTVQAAASPAIVDRYWELLRYPGNRAATIDRFSGYGSQKREELGPLPVPAVIIWGRDDKLIPLSSAAWFSSQLPNGRVTVLDDVGHIPMEEAPERSLAPVLDLLAKVGGAAVQGRSTNTP